MNPIDLVPIALGVVIIVLSQVFPGLASILLPVGGALVGAGLPNITGLRAPGKAEAEKKARAASLGHASPTILFLLALATLCALSVAGLTSCAHSNANLITALESCAATDPANSSAKQAVLTCIENAATGNYAQCLSDAPPSIVWTVDEIVCVVRAEEGQTATSTSTATATATATDATTKILRK